MSKTAAVSVVLEFSAVKSEVDGCVGRDGVTESRILLHIYLIYLKYISILYTYYILEHFAAFVL